MGALSDFISVCASPQVFKPYNSPYTLPIPASSKPSAMTTAPLVNYTASSTGGVMALAGTTTNFALRFSGGRRSTTLNINPGFGSLVLTPQPYPYS